MLSRVLSSIILLFCLFNMPWGVSALVGIVLLAYFPFFLEAPILFLLSDSLHGVSEDKFFGIYYISFLGSLAIFFAIETLKSKLRIKKANDFQNI